MTERTMTGLLRSAATLALLALTPTLAWAQTTPTSAISPQLTVEVARERIENQQYVYASIKDCNGPNGDEPATKRDVDELKTWKRNYTFKVSYPRNVPFVEAWLGTLNTDCSDPTQRQPMTPSTTQTACTKLGRSAGIRNLELEIPSIKMFNRDPAALSYTCDGVRGGTTYTVWILALQSETRESMASPVDVSLGSFAALKATFTPFTRRPDVPTDVVPKSGETALRLEFDRSSTAVALTRYKGYFDVGATSCTEGSPSVVDAGTATRDGGMDAGLDGGIPSTSDAGDGGDTGDTVDETGDETDDEAAGQIEDDDETQTDAGIMEPPLKGIDVRTTPTSAGSPVTLSGVGDLPNDVSIPAAVVEIDPAGNESYLSQIVCVKHVETTGFWDACQNDPNCAKDFDDGCSLSSAGRGSAVGLSFFALAVAALIRRRRRA